MTRITERRPRGTDVCTNLQGYNRYRGIGNHKEEAAERSAIKQALRNAMKRNGDDDHDKNRNISV